MRDEHLFEENQVMSKDWILEKFPIMCILQMPVAIILLLQMPVAIILLLQMPVAIILH